MKSIKQQALAVEKKKKYHTAAKFHCVLYYTTGVSLLPQDPQSG